VGSSERLELAAQEDEALHALVKGIAAIAKKPEEAQRNRVGRAIEDAIEVVEARRRAAITALLEREEKPKRTLEQLDVGVVVLGIVKSVLEFGAFIDIGGIQGLLHVTDIGEHPAKRFKPGDEVKVVVVQLDREKERILLGLPR
jgi:ribosomal protein S1